MLATWVKTLAKFILIAHVQYIKILTKFRGFLVIFLYSVWFSLCSSLFWQLRDNGLMENLHFFVSLYPEKT